MAQKNKSGYALKQSQGRVPARYDKSSHSWRQGAYKNYPPGIRSEREAFNVAWVAPKEPTHRFTSTHKLHPCASTFNSHREAKPLLPDCYEYGDKDV